jgi:hypothetical protein
MCTRNSEINQFMNRLSLRNEFTNFNVSNILGQNGNTLNLLDTLNIKNLSHEVFDEYVGLADVPKLSDARIVKNRGFRWVVKTVQKCI